MSIKIGGVKTGAAMPRDPSELSPSEQQSIMKLVAEEKKGQKAKPGKGDQPTVAPRYMVVRPDMVIRYMVVSPWDGIDAHQALVNKVVSDKKVTKSEANLVRKLFNRDIAEAKKAGKDIKPKVAEYLSQIFTGVKMDKASKDLIFGKGGPGEVKSAPKPPSQDHPIYILPPSVPGKPPKKDHPIYILPPSVPGNPPKKEQHPVYIVPPSTPKPPKKDQPIYILPPGMPKGRK